MAVLSVHPHEGVAGATVSAAAEGYDTFTGAAVTYAAGGAIGNTSIRFPGGISYLAKDSATATYVGIPIRITGALSAHASFMRPLLPGNTATAAALVVSTGRQIRMYSGLSSLQATSTTTLTVGQWYYLRWRVEGTVQQLQIYDSLTATTPVETLSGAGEGTPARWYVGSAWAGNQGGPYEIDSVTFGTSFADVAPPTIAFRGVSTTPAADSAKTFSTTIPAAAQPGDQALFVLGVSRSIADLGTITPPTGATLVAQHEDLTFVNAAFVWRKTIAAGEAGATRSVSWSGLNAGGILSCVVFSGVDSADPIMTSAVAEAASTSTSHVSPTVTLPARGELVVVMSARDTVASAWTAPGGLAPRVNALYDTGTGARISLALAHQPAAPGLAGGRTWTVNDSTPSVVTMSLALRPGTAVAPVEHDGTGTMAVVSSMSSAGTKVETEVTVARALDTDFGAHGAQEQAWFDAAYAQGYRGFITCSHTFWPDGNGVGVPQVLPWINTVLQRALRAGMWIAVYGRPVHLWEEALTAVHPNLRPQLQWFTLDVETEPGGPFPVTRAMVDGVASYGVRPVIYSNAFLWDETMGADSSFSDVPLWEFAGDREGWPATITEEPIDAFGGWNVPGNYRVAQQIRMLGNVPLTVIGGVEVDDDVVDLSFLVPWEAEVSVPFLQWNGDGLATGPVTTSSAGPGDNAPWSIYSPGGPPTIVNSGLRAPSIRWPGNVASYIAWGHAGLSSGSWRWYTRMPDLAGHRRLAVTWTGSTAPFMVDLNVAGSVQLVDNASTMLVETGGIIDVGVEYRIEIVADAGTIDLYVYEGDSTTEISHVTTTIPVETVTEFWWGMPYGGEGNGHWFGDSLAISDTPALIGPVGGVEEPEQHAGTGSTSASATLSATAVSQRTGTGVVGATTALQAGTGVKSITSAAVLPAAAELASNGQVGASGVAVLAAAVELPPSSGRKSGVGTATLGLTSSLASSGAGGIGSSGTMTVTAELTSSGRRTAAGGASMDLIAELTVASGATLAGTGQLAATLALAAAGVRGATGTGVLTVVSSMSTVVPGPVVDVTVTIWPTETLTGLAVGATDTATGLIVGPSTLRLRLNIQPARPLTEVGPSWLDWEIHETELSRRD